MLFYLLRMIIIQIVQGNNLSVDATQMSPNLASFWPVVACIFGRDNVFKCYVRKTLNLILLHYQSLNFVLKEHLPSGKLTYPTWGKGKSSSKVPFWRDMLVPRRVVCGFNPSQIESAPQVGVTMENIWNHYPDIIRTTRTTICWSRLVEYPNITFHYTGWLIRILILV